MIDRPFCLFFDTKREDTGGASRGSETALMPTRRGPACDRRQRPCWQFVRGTNAVPCVARHSVRNTSDTATLHCCIVSRIVQVFEGHAHYVMMVKFNLKDSNTFASASLDR